MILLDHMQGPVFVVPLSPQHQEEEQHTYPNPMPACVTLGHVTLINDNDEFLQAFDSGIESYYDDTDEYEQQDRTAQEVFKDLLETLTEDDPDMTLSWRLGFVAGRIAGLLNPDLAEADRFRPLESLSRKCEVLYPGPERWSIYSRAIHKAACIDNVPIEGLPVLESVSLKHHKKDLQITTALPSLLAHPDFQQGLADAQQQFLDDYQTAPLTAEEMIDKVEMDLSRQATERDKKQCRANEEQWELSSYFYNLGFVVGTIDKGLSYAQ